MVRWIGAGAFLFLLTAGPAWGVTPEEAAAGVGLRGYYVEEEASVPTDAMESLAADFDALYFVALATEAEGGADSFALQVIEQVGEGTVIVITPAELGAYSTTYDSGQLTRALEAAAGGDDPYQIDFRAVAVALQGGTGRSGAGWILWALLIAAVVWLAWWLSSRRRVEVKSSAGQLEEAREEIRKQLGVIANQIIEFSDQVKADQYPEAVARYRKANDIYDDADERLAKAMTLPELEALADDLDDARFEIEAAHAIVEGRPVANRTEPKPVACFFDPTHGTGVVEAEITTPAGNQRVWVCQRDADQLRQGGKPEPRTIPVDGNRIPAPRAPRSHGGLGLDWLDVFSIIVGGASQGLPYDWSRGGRRSGRRRGFPGPPEGAGSRTSRSRPVGGRARRGR